MTKELIELGLLLKKYIGKKDLEDGDYDLPEGVSLTTDKQRRWEDDGKYDYSTYVDRVVLNGESTDLYLQQSASRSGSYYSHYEYNYNQVELVEKKTKVVTVVDYVQIKAE